MKKFFHTVIKKWSYLDHAFLGKCVNFFTFTIHRNQTSVLKPVCYIQKLVKLV